MTSFAAICAGLGAPVKNQRWSWCALAPDGNRAIFTLWQDCFVGRRYPMTHQEDRDTNSNPNRPGWVEMKKVVEHCLKNPNAELLGVLCKAKDINADPWERKWVDDKTIIVLKLGRGGDGEVWAEIIDKRTR